MIRYHPVLSLVTDIILFTTGDPTLFSTGKPMHVSFGKPILQGDTQVTAHGQLLTLSLERMSAYS